MKEHTIQLIAEAGATKIDWVILSNQEPLFFKTTGYNPLQNDDKFLRQMLITAFPSSYDPKQVSTVQYFGTGCAQDLGKERVRKALVNFFAAASVEVFSDLMAVGRAIFKQEEGIVGILGTGSSVAYYSGKEITLPLPSLGYLLGDEGSGAYLGRSLLQSLLRKQMPLQLVQQFEAQYGELKELPGRLYQSPRPARLLASFVPFLARNVELSEIETLLQRDFGLFIETQLMPVLELYPDKEIGLVGGVAYHFKRVLVPLIGQQSNVKVHILESPLSALL